MQVKVYKFVDGSEIIAKEVNSDGSSVTLSKPRVIQIMPHESGRMGVGLMPWVISAPDEDITISNSFVMTSLDASLEIEGMYLQQTSSIDLNTRMQ